MEAQFEWREEYNTGVDIIDKEHQRLFKIINKLFRFREEEKDSQWTCQEGIKYFKGHAAKHFADEEAYMASIGYEGLEDHQRIHRSFREHTPWSRSWSGRLTLLTRWSTSWASAPAGSSATPSPRTRPSQGSGPAPGSPFCRGKSWRQ